MINEQHLPDDKDVVVVTVSLDKKTYELGLELDPNASKEKQIQAIKYLASAAVHTITEKKPEALGK